MAKYNSVSTYKITYKGWLSAWTNNNPGECRANKPTPTWSTAACLIVPD